MNKIIYKNVMALHPGYYVNEYITARDMTQEKLAKQLKTTPKHVEALINGEISLTDEMACKLSKALNTTIQMWIDLNNEYIDKKLEIDKQKRLDEKDDSDQIDSVLTTALNRAGVDVSKPLSPNVQNALKKVHDKLEDQKDPQLENDINDFG